MMSMGKDDVRIVKLERMKVASSKGFGKEPETIAWSGLLAWMKARGIPAGGSRFFGFNNPNPTPGSPNYGYEQWLALRGEPADAERELAAKSGIEIKDFAGGLYAVARHSGSPERLPQSWAALRLWVERSSFKHASHQWLEEFLNPEILDEPEPDWEKTKMDILFPIAE